MVDDINEDIKNLSNLDSFARFLDHIYLTRESYISELTSESGDHRIRHIAGSISAIDDILKTCNWDELRVKFSDLI